VLLRKVKRLFANYDPLILPGETDIKYELL